MKTSKTNKDFQVLQYEFAGHLRDPEHVMAPAGIEDRRLKVYRELFFGNMKSLVSTTFPVLRKFYSESDWDHLIRTFMIKHEAHTPLFLEVSSEFLKFLQESFEPRDCDPPFMLELAHYEWAELAVSVMDVEPDFSKINPHGHLLNEIPYLSPLVWSLAYQYPVHQIKPGYVNNEKPAQATYLLVFRKLDDSVEFMLLNSVSARLIELLGEHSDRTGSQLIDQIVSELEHPDPRTVIEGGKALLEQFRAREIILGTGKLM